MSLSIDICICTFRRPHIRETLLSLGSLTIPSDWTVRIIVADNDDSPSAESLVKETSPLIPFPVTYLHAPARNISIARNACLEAARADYLAFLDDDETASPQWLISLVETAQSETADAVLGPVDAIYEDHYPQWMKSGDFHATRPVWVNGQIITGYTCNLLLDRRSGKVSPLRFDPLLGKSGGEDTFYLSTLSKSGGKIAYAEKALLTEPVPAGRASFSWLLKRRFRSGQTHALLLLSTGHHGAAFKIKSIAVASAKAIVCLSGAVIQFYKPEKMISWLLRGALHIGVIARLLGKKDLVQYG